MITMSARHTPLTLFLLFLHLFLPVFVEEEGIRADFLGGKDFLPWLPYLYILEERKYILDVQVNEENTIIIMSSKTIIFPLSMPSS